MLSPNLARAQSDTSKDDAARAAILKQLGELHWIRGPQQVQLFGNSTLNVPGAYVFLNPADTAKLQTLEHNLGGGTQYFFAPEDLHWGAT